MTELKEIGGEALSGVITRLTQTVALAEIRHLTPAKRIKVHVVYGLHMFLFSIFLLDHFAYTKCIIV